jgi:tetratricopeptide (TPR) repeat protein
MKLKTPISLVIGFLLIFSTITAQTRNGWSSVRTNHLLVIGNADPENLRRVAVWLEYFHAAFAKLVSRNVIDSSVPTTVIVFRDDASFTPFKPTHNGLPASISGFFLPGDDVNYIALSLDPRGDPFATAFHEYVHLHVKDNVPGAPLWLNEGLAELYEALQFSGTDAVIGMPEHNYLYLLRQSEMLPLKTLFSIGTDSPHYNERDKAGIFYGESWALVHYLMFGDRARGDQFKRFLQRVANGDDAGKAIESTYGTPLDVIEQELETYVRRGNLTAQHITGVANSEAYRSYTATQRSTLTDSEATYYLADMVLHSGRDKAAERGFKESIAQDPGFMPAYAALGKMYVEQRRYTEAKTYLQKATATPQSYLIHYYYAYVLSREGISANVEVMREQLQQSIKLAPNYAPAHYLLSVIDRAGNTAARDGREPVKGDAIAEPTRTTSSRLLGGEGGPVAINDGRTVDSSGALPPVDDVLNKYMQAVGGAAALNAVTSSLVKGTVDVVGVIRGGTFEIYTVASDKSLTIMRTGPTVTVRVGYNGNIGWTQTPDGVSLLKGAELEAARQDANFYAIINIRKKYAKYTLAGKSKIGYRDVYVIDLQRASGAVDRIFLDAESYLLVRMNTTRIIKGVSVPSEIYYDDWHEVDGLKVPHVITESSQKQTTTLTIKEIKNNVPIDAKIFEKP